MPWPAYTSCGLAASEVAGVTARSSTRVAAGVATAVLLVAALLVFLNSHRAAETPRDRDDVRALIHQLCFGGSEAKARAKQSLIEHGPSSVDALATALDADSNQGCRASIAEVLASFGPAALPAADALARRLRRGDESAYAMAYALGQLGHEGIPLLERILRESESPAALLAALGKISDFEEEGRESVPAVLPLIRSDDPRVRAEALTTLQSIGAAGSVTGDDLALVRGAVRDENPDVRSAAAGALSTVCHRDDAQCAADLIHMLQSDEEPWVRAEAAKALGVIGAGGHGVRDALTVAAKDPDSMISAQAREALSSIR